PPPPSFVATLGKLHINEASLAWTDNAVQPAVSTSATANVELEHLTLGRDAEPATFALSGKVDGTLGSYSVSGQIGISKQSQGAKLDVDLRGLRAGPLAAYLPPGAAVTLQDGRLKTRVDATLAAAPAGGF